MGEFVQADTHADSWIMSMQDRCVQCRACLHVVGWQSWIMCMCDGMHAYLRACMRVVFVVNECCICCACMQACAIVHASMYTLMCIHISVHDVCGVVSLKDPNVYSLFHEEFLSYFPS